MWLSSQTIHDLIEIKKVLTSADLHTYNQHSGALDTVHKSSCKLMQTHPSHPT